MFHKSPINHITHLTLKVFNLQQSIDFYTKIVGFNLIELKNNSANLGVDNQVILTLKHEESYIIKTKRRTGLYHFAILLPDKKYLSQFVKHLDKHNIRIGASDHFVSEALYLNDPEGNGIEVYIDKNPATWEWHNGHIKMGVDPLDFDTLYNHSKNEVWDGLPKNTIIGHIHLHVNDLKQAEDFYVNVLGFKVVARYGHQAIFLSDGNYHHHIGLNIWNGTDIINVLDNETGLDHYTIKIGSLEKLTLIENNLNHNDIILKDSNNLIIKDPANIKINITH